MRGVTMVKFNRDGDLIFSTAKEPKICVWYTSNGKRLGVFHSEKPASGCDVNASSTMLASAHDDFSVNLWRVEDGASIGKIVHLSPCRAVGFAHDDSTLMAVTDKKMRQNGTIHLYHLPARLGLEEVKTTFNAYAKYESPDSAILYATWGPTNDTIYFSSDSGAMSILDVETQKVVLTKQHHSADVKRFQFDANYYTLVTASIDNSSKLLDTRNLEMIQSYKTDEPINDAAISPIADHVLVGGGVDAQEAAKTGGKGKFDLKIFHRVHGNLLGQFGAHFGTINTVAYHPSGKMIASGGHDGFVKLCRYDGNYCRMPGTDPIWKDEA
jgi:translation initiation factor 3 subunit I